MRCEEKSGFLMIHRCDRVASFPCTYCGKQLCPEHAFAIDPKQPPAPSAELPPNVATNPPTASQVTACLQCYRKQGQPDAQVPQDGTRQQQYDDDRYYRDPYYRYPYYGGYQPYYYNDYNDRDRRAFDRREERESTQDADAQGS